jgi:hypothetical protein
MSPKEPLPPSVDHLLAHRDDVRRRYPIIRSDKWHISRLRPSFIARLTGSLRQDTPSASFYRLYEFFVIDWNLQFRNELEYFCRDHPEWAVADLPDPADSDPLRYAILAVLTRLMCQSFNHRIDLGLPRDAPPIIEDFEELQARPKIHETVPAWAECVPPLSEPVYIPDANGHVSAEDDIETSPEFKQMKIIVKIPHFYFV